MSKRDGYAVAGGPPLGNAKHTTHVLAPVNGLNEWDPDLLELYGRLHRAEFSHRRIWIFSGSFAGERVIKNPDPILPEVL